MWLKTNAVNLAFGEDKNPRIPSIHDDFGDGKDGGGQHPALDTASGKVMQPARCSQSLSLPLRMA